MLTCVEICAGAGGQALGLDMAGFDHLALVEYESDYCAVLKNNKPHWNVICADVHDFDGTPYASVSAKWTMRSDRAQNSRTEALNLIRNRKGHLPHVVVVTGEPLPSRLASLALGTGDLDCVYHFALYELLDAVRKYGSGGREDIVETIENLVEGKRLKDISDLPLDLSV